MPTIFAICGEIFNVCIEDADNIAKTGCYQLKNGQEKEPKQLTTEGFKT